MGTDKVGALIIDNDVKLAKQIQAALPEYVVSKAVRFQDAKDALRDGVGGLKVSIAIMNADDGSGLSLSMCKYISEDPDKYKLKGVSIVLLTADEFSDNSLKFLEYVEPHFHTGEIDDSDFYLTISDAIDEAELYVEEDDEPVEIVQTKSPDKLMGMAFKMNEPPRLAVYSDESMKKLMAGLVGKNKEQVKQVLEVMKEAANERKEAGLPVDINYGQKAKSVKTIEHGNKWANKTEIQPGSDKGESTKSGNDLDEASNVSMLHKINDRAKVSNLLSEDEDVQPKQPQRTYVNQANVQTGRNVINNAQINRTSNVVPANKSGHFKVLVVDTDANTKKAFDLFLGDKYQTVQFDSSMKAIDYVVKNRIDIVVVSFNLNGVPGSSVLKSIKNQPNGMGIRSFMLVDEKAGQGVINKVLSGQGIAGVITKPIVKKQLIATLNKY